MVQTSCSFCLIGYLMMQIWCESIYSIEGTLYSRSYIHQFFPCGKKASDLIFSQSLLLFEYDGCVNYCSPLMLLHLLIDIKYGWKSAIIQKWWSLLVYGSLTHFTSIDSTVIFYNSRGEHPFLIFIIVVYGGILSFW